MLKAYLVSYTFYYDGEILSDRCDTQLCETPYAEEFSGTDFDSLWDFAYEHPLCTPFNLRESKKRQKIYTTL